MDDTEPDTEPDPKTVATHRRWWLMNGVILFFLLIVVAIPVVQKSRIINGIEDLGGIIRTEPRWLRETLPDEWALWLDKQTREEWDWVRPFESVIGVSLADTEVTDAGLIHLKELTQLNYLSLDDTGVTDAGLIHLKELNQLKILYLYNTKMTKAGIERLQAALPECFISD